MHAALALLPPPLSSAPAPGSALPVPRQVFASSPAPPLSSCALLPPPPSFFLPRPPLPLSCQRPLSVHIMTTLAGAQRGQVSALRRLEAAHSEAAGRPQHHSQAPGENPCSEHSGNLYSILSISPTPNSHQSSPLAFAAAVPASSPQQRAPSLLNPSLSRLHSAHTPCQFAPTAFEQLRPPLAAAALPPLEKIWRIPRTIECHRRFGRAGQTPLAGRPCSLLCCTASVRTLRSPSALIGPCRPV